MKKFTLLLILLCCLCTAFSDTDWNVESGNWAVASNWTNGVPDGTNGYINIRKSATSVCTLNTDEGLIAARWIMQNGQTLNIENGGRFGAQWSRVGRNTASYVNLSGNGTYMLNNDDLYCGLEGGSMEWRMYGTSSLITQGDDGDDGEEVHFGYNNGYGLLQLNGSGITVNVDRIHFSNRSDQGAPSSTLEFVLDADGMSTIVTQRAYIAEAGTADLLLTDPGVTLVSEEDMVLIKATSTYGIGGNGVFDSLNGGPAEEGTLVVLGGNVYALTYQYNADDGSANDVALVFVQSGKHLATNPVPAFGTTVNIPPTTLSWINPDPNDGVSDITCTVYFGMAPADPNRNGMDSVTLAANANSVEINESNFPTYGAYPIQDANDFYWVVDCVDASPGIDPAFGKAPVSWSFSTLYNQDPVVDAGSDQVDWGLPKTVSLSGSATDDGLPNPPAALTVTWTVLSGPDSAVINSPNAASTTVDITESGVYVFRLTADDGVVEVSDTVQVIIGEDSCQASYLSGENYSDTDFDHNCIVDLADFAEFAADWMACTNTLEGCL